MSCSLHWLGGIPRAGRSGEVAGRSPKVAGNRGKVAGRSLKGRRTVAEWSSKGRRKVAEGRWKSPKSRRKIAGNSPEGYRKVAGMSSNGRWKSREGRRKNAIELVCQIICFVKWHRCMKQSSAIRIFATSSAAQVARTLGTMDTGCATPTQPPKRGVSALRTKLHHI